MEEYDVLRGRGKGKAVVKQDRTGQDRTRGPLRCSKVKSPERGSEVEQGLLKTSTV